MRYPDDVPVLTDGVVTLRAALPEDAGPVVDQCRDPESQAWTTVPLEYTHEDALEFLTAHIPQAWRDDTEYVFVMTAEHEGEPRFLGTIALRMEGERRGEVAFGAHPWGRRRGLVARALRLLVAWGFEELDLRTLSWWAFRGNWASRRLAWSVGFAVEGSARQWLPQRGELRDAWVGTLRRGDPMRPTTPWRSAVPLTDGRVSLRPPEERDDPRIVESCSDPEIVSWLGNLPHPYRFDDARWWRENGLEGAADNERLSWVVADPVSDECIGAIDVFSIREGWQAELGYWTHPDARGKGLTSAACRLVLQHAFRPAERGGLGLVRVQGVVAEGNVASARVLERIGMQRAGTYRAHVNTRTGRRDGWLYDVLSDGFRT